MPVAGLIAVGLGGALGCWLRWGLSSLLNPIFPTLPLGTLAANYLGGFLIGVAVEFFTRYFPTYVDVPPEARLFVITGFMGGLTTFSTFSAESVTLILHKQFEWALVHGASHLFGSIALTILGIATVKWLIP